MQDPKKSGGRVEIQRYWYFLQEFLRVPPKSHRPALKFLSQKILKVRADLQLSLGLPRDTLSTTPGLIEEDVR